MQWGASAWAGRAGRWQADGWPMVKHLVTLPCFIGPSSLPAPRFPASRLVSDYAQARQAQAQAGTGGHRLAQAGTGSGRLRALSLTHCRPASSESRALQGSFV